MALALRTARAWGKEPSAYFQLGKRDQALMEGETFLSEHMTDMGYPDWVTQDPNNMGRFKADTFQDFAREALEVAQKYAKRDEPGMVWRVRFTPPEQDSGLTAGQGE